MKGNQMGSNMSCARRRFVVTTNWRKS